MEQRESIIMDLKKVQNSSYEVKLNAEYASFSTMGPEVSDVSTKPDKKRSSAQFSSRMENFGDKVAGSTRRSVDSELPENLSLLQNQQ